MQPIHRNRGFEPIKMDVFKPKEKSMAAKIMSAVAKEMKRPIGEYLGKQFSKVRNITEEQKSENLKLKIKLIQEGKGNKLQLKIGDKHILDGFTLKGKNSHKWIVVFNGMGDSYESHLNALGNLSQDVGANILAFNYRGVGDSSGKPSSIKDWVDDGRYMLEYLRQKGVKPEDIVIYGHSLGGGVASDVYRKQEKKPGLVIESSPKVLTQAIKLKRGTIASFLAKVFNWDFNSYQVIKNATPQEHIALTVNRRDPTVRYQEASVYKKISKKGLGQKIQRIKIGAKQETFETVDVKTGFKVNTPKGSKEMSKEAKEYQKQYQKLKKVLPHPHERVMDRRLKSLEGDENLRPFKEKFKKEDDQAYEGIVTVFKGFLNIS